MAEFDPTQTSVRMSTPSVKPGPRALSVALPFNPSKRNSGDGRETSQWRHFRKLESTLGNGHCELVSPTSCTLLGQVACSLFDRQDEWYAASIWATHNSIIEALQISVVGAFGTINQQCPHYTS